MNFLELAGMKIFIHIPVKQVYLCPIKPNIRLSEPIP